MKDKKDRIELTELFMAKAGKNGWDRCFHGTIKRESDSNGNQIVYGKIKISDGYICALAKDQSELGEKLDEMVVLVLDYEINKITVISSLFLGIRYVLN